MAYPLRKAEPEPWTDEPEHYEGEFIFRTTLDTDGRVQVLRLPPTRDNVNDPRVEDEVSQNNPHARVLSPMAVAIRTDLESREGADYGVFQELLVRLEHHPGFAHDVAPDLLVVAGIDDAERVGEGLDVISEGLAVPLVIEVVSTKYKANREKDEIGNVAIYDRLGVGDYVMVYPRFDERGEPLRLAAKTRGLRGALVDNVPDRQGRIRIHSLDYRISVDEKGRLALEDAKTGERIWFHVDERRLRLAAEQRAEEQAEARREAERRAETALYQGAETLVLLLEARGHTLTDDERRRILACPDPDTLRRWTLTAVDAGSPSELWGRRP